MALERSSRALPPKFRPLRVERTYQGQPVYTIREAAGELGLTVRAVYWLFRRGRVKALALGGQLYVSAVELDRARLRPRRGKYPRAGRQQTTV